MTVAIAIIIVFITVFLAIGYTQPFSRIRVEVYNVWHTGASIMVFVDNATNGKVYEVPSMAQMVLGFGRSRLVPTISPLCPMIFHIWSTIRESSTE